MSSVTMLIPRPNLLALRNALVDARNHTLVLECELANVSDPAYSIATQPSPLQLMLQEQIDYLQTLLPTLTPSLD